MDPDLPDPSLPEAPPLAEAPTLAEALASAWRLLTRAAADRRSPMHTPVVSSVTADNHPDARIMVLRAATRATATLRFHTDARAPKVAALDGAPVHILAYHPGEAIQLRLSATARIVRDGAEIDHIWATSTPFARRIYLVEAPPGTPLAAAASGLPASIEGRKPTEAELIPARANFALVIAEITTIDWLHLAASGHRRARFDRDDDWRGEWLAP